MSLNLTFIFIAKSFAGKKGHSGHHVGCANKFHLISVNIVFLIFCPNGSRLTGISKYNDWKQFAFNSSVGRGRGVLFFIGTLSGGLWSGPGS